jgi:RNA polymerase sigma factor (sigma-70 family)
MSESAQGVPATVAGGPAWPLSRDERLAKRAAAGDARAFEALFKRYSQPLYRYCRAILTEPADAEDAVQATMAKALRALPGERREIALRPWLYRIAHNESISILRARRETAGLEAAEVAATSSIELTVEMRERVRTLVTDLATLPERQRASLVMRELSDLSYEDIAAALSTSPAAARQSVYEARAALLEVAEGREMDCARARQAISAGDRRVLRGRKVRAHLRGCRGCRDFETAIAARRETFGALAPPLAAPAALALVQAAIGGGSAGAGLAGTAGAGFAGGAAVKAAVAVVAAAIGGGAAATGVLDRGGGPDKRSAPAPVPTAPGGAAEPASAPPAAAESATHAAPAARHESAGGGHQSPDGSRGGSTDPPGNSGQAPGHTGGSPSDAAPGQTGTAPGHSGATPAQGAPPPGQSGAAPGQAHANAGGGGQATAPGQTGASPGMSEHAPGHSAAAAPAAEPHGNATGHATAPGQNK